MIKTGKKAKILVFFALLLIIPVLNGVTIPTSPELHAIYLFFFEIGRYWLENLERLIGPIVGVF